MSAPPPSLGTVVAPTAKAVPAVRRAAAILWLLTERRPPLTLSEIARAADVLPSTVLHILRELVVARLLREAFRRIRWQAPLAFGRRLAQVEQAKVRGFAEDGGLFSPGVVTLTAPVLRRDGSVAGVIGVVSVSASLADPRRRSVAALVASAEAIGNGLAAG